MSDKKDEVTKSPDEQNGEQSNAINAMDRGMVIPGDVVNKATENLPDAQRSAIRGMHAYAIDNKLTNGEVGKLLKKENGKPYDGAAISLVFRGKYPAGLENITSEIADFLALEEKRNKGRALPYIKTELYEQIEAVNDAARTFQKMAFFFGDNQIGKSEANKHYRTTHNHGSTVYTEFPAGGALCYLLAKLAEGLRIGTQSRETDLRRRIMSAVDDRMLLIFDEVDRAIPSSYVPKSSLRTFDFICELFNERKCGVVLIGNSDFRKHLEEGEVATIMRKTRRRRLCAMQLPALPSRKDLNTFAAAYGLPPSSGATRELETKIIEQEALGVWLTLLRMAAVAAKDAKQKMSWDHVVHAYHGRNAMENPNWSK